jgi:hypothetical protein
MRRKLNRNQVQKIYLSKKSTTELSKKFNISKTQVRLIKRKKAYQTFLIDLQECPPYNRKINKDLVIRIYQDIVSRKTCQKKYGVTWNTIKRIKRRETYPQYTKDLKEPGDIIVWGLTEQQRREIYWYPDDIETTSNLYQVTPQTVRNIRKKYYPMPRDLTKVFKKVKIDLPLESLLIYYNRIRNNNGTKEKSSTQKERI